MNILNNSNNIPDNDVDVDDDDDDDGDDRKNRRDDHQFTHFIEMNRVHAIVDSPLKIY